MLQKSNIPPKTRPSIYFITGEDEFKKRSYLDRLKSKLLDKGSDAFNYNLYHAKDAKAAEIIDFLDTILVSGESKVVALIEPESLAAEEGRQLGLYMKKNRQEHSYLVMLGGKPSAKLDKFASLLPKYAVIIDTLSAKGEDISDWVVKEFEKNKKKIGRRSADLISDYTKHDIGRAVSLIEQASLFAGSRENITDDDIMLFLDMPVENSTFLLLDAINEKKPGRAILILKELLKKESSPTQMVGFLTWHVSRFIRLKKMLARNASKAEILSVFKMSSYRLDKLLAQIGQFSLPRLGKDLEALAQTDLLIKTGSIKDEYLLEALVVKLSS